MCRQPDQVQIIYWFSFGCGDYKVSKILWNLQLFEIIVQKPCGQGCIEKATCLPHGVFDGSAMCTCKDGYTGNGTVCTAGIKHIDFKNTKSFMHGCDWLWPLVYGFRWKLIVF